MELHQILEKYDTVLLDQISADKIDEAISVRLPKPVVVQEIISALNSLSYISGKVTYAKPPTFAIVNLILHAPNYSVEIEGFREKVLAYVQELSQKATLLKDTAGEKNYSLYTNILARAWESDGFIDKSESYILEFVKGELKIWEREHFVLGHHPGILKWWDIQQEYQHVRNQLLMSGIVLMHENKYIIAGEVALQLRRALGMEIQDDAYRRLLNGFTKDELAIALGFHALTVSGPKPEMIERVNQSLIPASILLDAFHVETLREFCRRQQIPSSGTKVQLIQKMVQFFDLNKDLQTFVEEPVVNPLPAIAETREMEKNIFVKVLFSLTNQQLYDVLQQSYLTTSGSKEEKVARIADSPWSERTIFHRLRKDDLSLICRKFNLPFSGSKQELVDRVMDISLTPSPESVPVAIIADDLVMQAQTVPTELLTVEHVGLPANMEAIQTAFPALAQDEQIVLAIIKEAKSLSEHELERVVTRHGLGWFLHRAQMAEIIAKLKRNHQQALKIKSVQSSNIYQWIEEGAQTDNVMEKRSARDIIDALRHGVVPKTNVNLLMVGQQSARKHLAEILGELHAGKSHFKFIRGQYGAGKTFLLSWLKEFALENEYAVSFLNISHDQPLSDLPIFFSGLINGLRTPEKPDASALVDILESWLLNIHVRTMRMEGAVSNIDKKKLSSLVEKRIEAELSALNDIEPGFSPALRTFYQAKLTGNVELSANAVAWIMGSRSLSAQVLREIGVKGELEANNVFPRMRALLQVLQGARYKGLLLMVDELELVRKFPHARQREQALETLRLLIDEAGKNALPGCLILFTGTDEFFEDERYGLKSYEALAERVKTPLKHENFVSMRQPIIILESLDKERLAQVIFKVRELYGVAYGCDPASFGEDEQILQLIDYWTLFGNESTERKPRPILREFIQMLDLCEENKGLKFADFLQQKGIQDKLPTTSILN